MERRTYLAALGGGLAVGTAGCIDGGDTVGDSEYESGYRPDGDVTEADLEAATPTAEIGLDEEYEYTRERVPESFHLDADLSGDWGGSGEARVTTDFDGAAPRGHTRAETPAERVEWYADETGTYVSHPDQGDTKTGDKFAADPFLLLGLVADLQRGLAFRFTEGGTVPTDGPDAPDRISAFRYDFSAIDVFEYDRYGSAGGELIIDEVGAVRELHATFSDAERETETPGDDDDGLRTPTPGRYGSTGEGSADLVMTDVGATNVERPDWVDDID